MPKKFAISKKDIMQNIYNIRDKWVSDPPKIEELIDNHIPHSYYEGIRSSERFQQVMKAYPHYQLVLATKLLSKHGELLYKERNLNSSLENEIKIMWVNGLRYRAGRVATTVYNAILLEEKFSEFLDETQMKFKCIFLPTKEIKEIIPHISIPKLYKEKRLRGAVFNFKIKYWFYSKDDAERIAIEEAEFIAKYREKAREKERNLIIENNISTIESCFSYNLECYGGIKDVDFLATTLEEIFQLPSVKYLIYSGNVRKTGIPLEAEVFFDTKFKQEMKNNKKFENLVNAELKERKEINEAEEKEFEEWLAYNA